MIQPQMLRHPDRIGGFVITARRHADGIGGNVRLVPFGVSGNQAGIQPAGQEQSERHIGNQPFGDRAFQRLPDCGDRFLIGWNIITCDRIPARMPVAFLRVQIIEPLFRIPAQHMAGCQPADTEPAGLNPRHIFKMQEVMQTGNVRANRIQRRMLEQRLDLRGKDQLPLPLGVVERLFAEPVTDQRNAAILAIPESKGEHTVEAVERGIEAPMTDGLKQHLGIGSIGEVYALGLQLPGDILVIINLAVEDQAITARLIMAWLVAAFRRNDRQSQPAEGHMRFNPFAAHIRPAIGDAVEHPGQDARRIIISSGKAGNATHDPAYTPASSGRLRVSRMA